MAIYAIGDVHGCLDELQRLLDKVRFDPALDRLWFVGDLINRGPRSLDVVRFVRSLGDGAVAVMGNHEARAIAGLSGHVTEGLRRHMGYLLDAPDVADLYYWLRRRPFLHRCRRQSVLLVHAGLYPAWSVDEAEQRANLLQQIMIDDRAIREFFSGVPRGPLPCKEPDEASLMDRLRFDFLIFTRVRLCSDEGQLLWPCTPGGERTVSPYLLPPENSRFKAWFENYPWKGATETVIYGHWAAAGLVRREHIIGLDSGCAYGGRLTALHVDHPQRPLVQVECPQYVPVDRDG
ncbi:MAG: symmetrical bis(5'-nucleosyl)-tetraphosphatase [Magnetococcus sp. WYHC-3]